MLCWMHIYVLGTAVSIHLGACILLFNSSFYHELIACFSKECSIFLNRCEFLLLDVIFISSFFSFSIYFGINLRRKEKQSFYLTLLYGIFASWHSCWLLYKLQFIFFLFFFLQIHKNTRWIYAYAFKALHSTKIYTKVIITFLLCSL